MYQSRKRKYVSRKEKYDRSTRFIRILWAFSIAGLAVLLFFRRQMVIDWASTFLY